MISNGGHSKSWKTKTERGLLDLVKINIILDF